MLALLKQHNIAFPQGAKRPDEEPQMEDDESVDVFVNSECIYPYILCIVPRSVYNVIESCHAPMFRLGSFYNVNKSCQVIVGNPPIGQGLKSP